MKIVEGVSHLDHGLSPAHVAWLLAQFADREQFFTATVALPAELSSLECALHGPLMGDGPVPDADIRHERRGERASTSRMCGRKPRETRLLSVIAGPADAGPCVLYTAYGGPIAPREPGDVSSENDPDEYSRSVRFWMVHALSGAPVVNDSAALDPSPARCGEEHPFLCSDPAGEIPLVCGLPKGHEGEHEDSRQVDSAEAKAGAQ